MEFTLLFIANLGRMLATGGPVLLFLFGCIAVLSLLIGRREGWSVGDSLYFGFITATTVGYGDIRPTASYSKFLAVFVALVGLITMGIVIALAFEAVTSAYDAVTPGG